MGIAQSAWKVIFFVIIINGGSYSLECNDIDLNKCLCFNSNDVGIQCPTTEEPQIGISVSKGNRITLQCLNGSAPYIDLNMISDMNISDAKLLKIEFCYLNTSFTNILKKFNIHSLNTLSFDGQDDYDGNIMLSRESFESLQDLKSLTLSHSTFHLSKDFLANTPNLLTLVLSKNIIGDLVNYFKYVPKLKMLELSISQITMLPDRIFEDLSNLTRLQLFGNNITSLSRDTFVGLQNLQLLELSTNHITELPEDTFADLHKLVNISLRGNNVRRAYRNVFSNNPALENIRFGYNRGIVLSDYIFANLSVLRTVELFSNLLESVPENVFQNCQKLEKITLNNNLLTSLPKNIFRDLKKLKVLDLSENKLNSLPDEVFSSLVNLDVLNLSGNQLSVITDRLFKQLDHLKRLDLHRNTISVIEPNAFYGPRDTLSYLDISFNKWNNSYNNSIVFNPLNSLTSIEKLILSHNEITAIPNLIASVKLNNLNLSFNRIDYLEVADFAHSLGFTSEIDLRNNSIKVIDFHLAELLAKVNTDNGNNNDRDTFILKLINNPIVCDCHNYDLIRYNHHEMKQLRTFVNIDQDGLLCSNQEATKILDLNPSDINCPMEDGCPDSCKCLYKPYDTSVVVDCSFKNLTAYPLFNFTNKNSTHEYNQTSLILHGNELTKGPSINDLNYSNITILDLSANNITDIDWIPPRIKELNLDNNLIKNLDSRFIRKLKNSAIEKLSLKGNPWECRCNSLDLQKYLMQYYHQVNSTDVYCENTHSQLVKLTDICKVPQYLSVMLPTILTVLLFFAIAFAIYYRYQSEIKIYLFAKNMCLWFVTEEELDKDKTYDVFISYSNQDEKFVIDHLLPELENGDSPFKVCIHIRDWIPGEFIAEQVVNSVKDSRRTVVVLSNNFVDSVWGKLEFRTAHTEAISEGRARVIVILYGDLDENKLDQELKAYLKTNTYVKWGDKYFWNKLKYALPHSRNFYERNKKHAKVMLKIEDKFDLIKNPPSPCNTSTPPITLDPSLLESDLRIDLTGNLEGENPLLTKQITSK